MATSTTNYGFKKPDESDFYDVSDQNKNWDLADETLKNLDTPTFEDYTESTAVPSATDAIDQIKSKGKLGTLLSNIKAAFKGACLIGHIVNNCVTDNAALPLSAAQGKALHDLYTQLYSEIGSNYDKNTADAKLIGDCNAPGVKIGKTNSDTKNSPSSEKATDKAEGLILASFPTRTEWNSEMFLPNSINPRPYFRGISKEGWSKWAAGVLMSDLTEQNALKLTALNGYSFEQQYTYGYKRAGLVELHFQLTSAFDRSKSMILSLPDDCAVKKQLWFPVYPSMGGSIIARGLLYGTSISIVSTEDMNGKSNLYGHVVYTVGL